jgi:hypothetical protein
VAFGNRVVLPVVPHLPVPVVRIVKAPASVPLSAPAVTPVAFTFPVLVKVNT